MRRASCIWRSTRRARCSLGGQCGTSPRGAAKRRPGISRKGGARMCCGQRRSRFAGMKRRPRAAGIPWAAYVRIFITGATGFVGSHFVNRLALSAGLCRSCAASHGVSMPRVALYASRRGSLARFAGKQKHDLAGTDVLVHLAAAGIGLARAAGTNFWKETRRCSATTAAYGGRAAGVTRIVAAGSCLSTATRSSP